ncbi:MAG: 23S rRNA (adenine(2503)-C(2))-methyltransferase RlmN, partial [Candidatus Omnitrophica bacterium]|nr:23S rRNA (adenine(2503)-C(2))-methyltransferase RlmN [Candidatus Omnitrophota bacterium]
VNDSVKEATELGRLAAGLGARVNLIAMNPVQESRYGAPGEGVVLEFQERVRKQGAIVNLRRPRGTEVTAACGQLRLTRTAG